MQPRGVLTGQPDLGTGLSMVWGEFHWQFRDGSGGPQTPHEKIQAHTQEIYHVLLSILSISHWLLQEKVTTAIHVAAIESLTSFY